MQTCILFRGKVNWTDDSESLAFGDEGVPCSGALSRTAYGALGLTSSRCIAPAENGGDEVLPITLRDTGALTRMFAIADSGRTRTACTPWLSRAQTIHSPGGRASVIVLLRR
jgi:hypothetical protein